MKTIFQPCGQRRVSLILCTKSRTQHTTGHDVRALTATHSSLKPRPTHLNLSGSLLLAVGSPGGEELA
jgi:hypothetical protein